MPYTYEDFDVDYILEHFPELLRERQREVMERLPPELRREVVRSLPPEQRREFLQSFPVEELLAVLSEEQIRQYLEQRAASQPATPRRTRRRKQ